MAKKDLPRRPDSLNGPTGLLTAVIHQAMLDYHEGDRTAVSYFAGPVYRQHLELLGLPGDWLPDTMRGKAMFQFRNTDKDLWNQQKPGQPGSGQATLARLNEIGQQVKAERAAAAALIFTGPMVAKPEGEATEGEQ